MNGIRLFHFAIYTIFQVFFPKNFRTFFALPPDRIDEMRKRFPCFILSESK